MKLGKVLFVGIGGGNDVFSTVLAVQSLHNLGWSWNSCDIAGVLSPFHRHTCIGTDVVAVFCTKPQSERFLVRNDGEVKIGFVDATVSRMIHEKQLYGIREVFGLSLEFGTEGLTQTFRTLSRFYDYFVLVDVGGDCFYRGKEDGHVLSPMFDGMVLRAFVDSKVPGILFEAGPGTDGELEPEALEKTLLSPFSLGYPVSKEVKR